MIIKTLALWLLLIAFVLGDAGFVNKARATLRIDVTQGNVDPVPMAVLQFSGASDTREMSRWIAQVVRANLVRSGIFHMTDPNAFIEHNMDIDARPNFANWQLINVQGLVNGQLTLLPDGRLSVAFRLWDITSEAEMVALSMVAPPSDWRRLAHLISDAIYERLTGEVGYFDTRIVYIAESGPKDARIKALAIMDQDGANRRVLIRSGRLLLTPRFSPFEQEITYLSYQTGSPRVFLLNIDTMQQEVVGDFPGMTFAPRFSPDGQKIIMSLVRDGHSDIYTMDLRTRATRRLTATKAIDTAPSYAPDGRNIVFESDRSGRQQIYVMDADGRNVRRISRGRGRYATPVWSPRGDLIAFTKIDKGRFTIGVMRPDGRGERVLTSGYHNEGPSWSPNGRVLIFFRETRGTRGGPSLWSVDVTGYNERKIDTGGMASDPAWSPLIR